MADRVKGGLVTGMDSKKQGVQVVKTRSPNNDANVYGVYIEDMDGKGWKYAFTNEFKDAEYDQEGKPGNFRLEMRFQDLDEPVPFEAGNYKAGRPAGYNSPLYSNTNVAYAYFSSNWSTPRRRSIISAPANAGYY